MIGTFIASGHRQEWARCPAGVPNELYYFPVVPAVDCLMAFYNHWVHRLQLLTLTLVHILRIYVTNIIGNFLHWSLKVLLCIGNAFCLVLLIVLFVYFVPSVLVPTVLWRCCLGRKGIRPVNNWVVGCWRGYVRVKVQICIWRSWCNWHSLSLAPVNPDWFYLSGAGSPR